MPSKDEKKAELERQYKEQLEAIEAEADEDGNDDDDIIVLRGNARKQFLEALAKSGVTLEDAKDTAEEIEEEVEEEVQEDTEEEGKEKEEKKSSSKSKEEKPKDEEKEKDPKPPSRMRYFG